MKNGVYIHCIVIKYLLFFHFSKQGNHSEGLRLLEIALTLEPSNTQALTSIGNCFTHLERFEEAEKVLQRALDIAPNYSEALLNLGALRNKQGKHL